MSEPSAPAPLAELPKLPTELNSDVQQYSLPQLHHVEVQEKIVLPTKEDMEAEKAHEQFKEAVEKFDKGKVLRQVSTEEKQVLPTQEDIAHEKLGDLPRAAAAFNKEGLKHVEPSVKTGVEGGSDGSGWVVEAFIDSN